MPIRARRGHWHYRLFIKGREYTGTTGLAATEPNRKKAEKLAQAKGAEIENGGFLQEPDKPFGEAAEEFLTWCENVEYRAKPGTWMRIRTSFATAKEFFGARAVSSIGAGDIERYKEWRAAVHRVRDITIRHDLDALSIFFKRYAEKFGWCKTSPLDGVKRPSDADAVRMHVLSPDEERTYFARANSVVDKAGRRNLYDVGRLLMNQGCRPEEIMALKKEHVNLDAKTAQIAGGKTRAARRLLDLTDESVGILKGRMDSPGPWVFPSERHPGNPITKLSNSHDRVCREAGVSFVLYDLRHTFATRAAEAGVDIATLAAILGHNGLRTVQKYIHVSADHKKSAMKKYEAAKPAQL